jgi:hypothetical protein
VQQIIKEYKIALKNAEDRAKIAKKKLFNLKNKKLLKHYKIIAATRVFKIAALKKEKLN